MPNPFSLPMAGRSLRNLVARPATRRYPAEPRPAFAGARGTLELDLDSCVFCGLCVRRCPAVALECSREEQWFALEQLRCISCGVCVDVCNKRSLSLTVAPPATYTTSGDAQTDPAAPRVRPGRREWRKAAAPALPDQAPQPAVQSSQPTVGQAAANAPSKLAASDMPVKQAAADGPAEPLAAAVRAGEAA